MGQGRLPLCAGRCARSTTKQRPALPEETEKDYGPLRERHASEERAADAHLGEGTRQSHADRVGRLRSAGSCRRSGRAISSTTTLPSCAEFIDWQPFFNAWEMKGKISRHPQQPGDGRGRPQVVRRRAGDARHPDREKWLTASSVIGFFPANAVGDDVEVYTDDTRSEVLTRLHNLRQRGEHRAGIPNKSLATSLSPRDTGLADYVGAFAVTAGLGSQDKIIEFKAALDDYSAILLESIADRFAEAFAERMHQRVRQEFWGYQPDEQLDNEALIGEIRRNPSGPGYPACPEHTEKMTIWELLDVNARTGIELTESMAMWPGAAVSGWYFSHPAVAVLRGGPVGPGPVADYARRGGMDRCGKPSAGSDRTSATTRRTEPWFGMGACVKAVLWDMDGTWSTPSPGTSSPSEFALSPSSAAPGRWSMR